MGNSLLMFGAWWTVVDCTRLQTYVCTYYMAMLPIHFANQQLEYGVHKDDNDHVQPH